MNNIKVSQNLINLIVERCRTFIGVEKIVLFGSRARGDFTDKSDYDIAIYGEIADCDKRKMRSFCSDELPTLHKVDLLFMDEQSSVALMLNVEVEGITLYEQTQQ